MSQKNKDKKNRWRNVTVAFRMSPEENEQLDQRVKLSGFGTRQEYIIQSVLHQRIIAQGNPLMLVQFRKNLKAIEEALLKNEKIEDMDIILEPLNMMLEILEGFHEKNNPINDLKNAMDRQVK